MNKTDLFYLFNSKQRFVMFVIQDYQSTKKFISFFDFAWIAGSLVNIESATTAVTTTLARQLRKS
jgi:hypothetical protein